VFHARSVRSKPMTSGRLVSVGVDLGGMGSRFAIVSKGAIIAQSTVPTAELGAGPITERVARLAGVVRALVPDGYLLDGVGIGASGPMELPNGAISNPDTLPWFSGFDLTGMLAADLGVPVVIDNDAVAAGIGEYYYGAGRGCDRLLVVTLGTGIGVVFLDNGRPFRDRRGQHPEGGHLPVLPGGPRCYCGLAGCWETSACRESLEERAERVTGTRDLGVASEVLQAGNAALEAVFVDYGHAVGRGLAILDTVYSPARAVLCGSTSRFLPYFAEGLSAEFERSPGYVNELAVVESELGDVAGAVGASVLGRREHLAKEV